MTEQDWIELGRRAVACKGWRWMPGMLARRQAWPDLRDPATLGCVLALVREAWPNVVIWVARDCAVDPLDDTEYMLDDVEGWTVCGGCGDDYVGCFGSGKTEAAALVAALEAAGVGEG